MIHISYVLCNVDYTPRQVAWRRPQHKKFGLVRSRLLTREDGTEEMMAKISSHTPTMHNPYNRYTYDTPITASNKSTPTDLLSAAYALLPNTSSDIRHTSLNRFQHDISKRSYDHIDMPGRPLPRKNHSVSGLDLRRKDSCSGLIYYLRDLGPLTLLVAAFLQVQVTRRIVYIDQVAKGR